MLFNMSDWKVKWDDWETLWFQIKYVRINYNILQRNMCECNKLNSEEISEISNNNYKIK